jgi:hypothetical protein
VVLNKVLRKVFGPKKDEVSGQFRILYKPGNIVTCIERIVLLDFIHCLMSQEQTKLCFLGFYVL